MIAVASVMLFAEHAKDFGSMGGALAWTWKVALVMDTGGLTLAFDRETGLDLSVTEVINGALDLTQLLAWDSFTATEHSRCSSKYCRALHTTS